MTLEAIARPNSRSELMLEQESCAIAKMTARCAIMSASHVSSQSRTRVKLNRVFFVRFLASPKFPHVSLGIGGWPLGAAKNECVRLIVRAVSFEDFQPRWSQSCNVTDKRTVRRTDGM